MNFRPLTDEDYPAFMDFLENAYGEHILAHKPFLQWYFGGAPDAKKNYPYDAYVAITNNQRIVGLYGALPIKISIDQQYYSMCWFVNGMVLSEYRGKGIGSMLVGLLTYTFDIIGVFMFTEAVIPLYEKRGFNLFQRKTMKRFIISLSEQSYKLVEYLGHSPRKAKEASPIYSEYLPLNPNVIPFTFFDKDIIPLTQQLEKNVKVTTHRSLSYLKWRFTENPLTYRKFQYIIDGKIKGYIVIREERFYPLKIWGARIIDIVGEGKELLSHIIAYAQKQKYAFVEFGYVGNLYDDILKELSFIELKGDTFTWWPMINNFMVPRENREWILLGSYKYPDLVKKLRYEDLYFTRSDSDRDRYNGEEK